MKASGERYAQAALAPGKRHGVHCTGVGWAPEPVWMGVVNLIPAGVRTPNHLACNEFAAPTTVVRSYQQSMMFRIFFRTNKKKLSIPEVTHSYRSHLHIRS